MLKLIIRIHLLFVPEMRWLLKLGAPAMLLHVWWETKLHLLHLAYVLELHIFFPKMIYLSIKVLSLLFWEMISSLWVATALWILSTAITVGMVQPWWLLIANWGLDMLLLEFRQIFLQINKDQGDIIFWIKVCAAFIGNFLWNVF